MAKEICISSTPHETRLAIVEDEQLTEVYYERENEYTLAGSIYKGRVTRVLPGMQSAFVDIGLERDAFLYVTDFLEEQEDSADFERLSGNGRQEEQETREVRETKAPQGGESAAAPAPAKRGPGEEFEDGTRRWRGRRGRRKGFRQQPGQEPSASPSIRVEPSSSVSEQPARAFRQQEETEPAVASPAGSSPLPLSLPGESISKYGGKSSGPAPSQNLAVDSAPRSSFAASKPSTLIEAPLQWDGGSMLPGESISRYRNAPEGSHILASEEQSPQSPAPEAAVGRALEVTTEPIPESEMQVFEEAPEAVSEAHGDPEEETAKFEPEEASASYRLDPSAPSEFRFSSPSAAVVEEEEQYPVVPELEQTVPAWPSQVPAHFVSSQQEETAQEVQSGSESMHAERQAAQQFPGEESGTAEVGFEDLDDDLQASAAAQAGLIEEEEVSDEEEYDFTSFYTHADDHDLEDMEEETLDQDFAVGAEVEEMVRDAHLDQRVSAGEAGAIEDETGSEEGDFVEEFAPGEAEAEGAAEPAAGQPARREREDGRRGRGGRQDHRRRPNGRRQMAQTSNLPIISELLKQGQEILVQIAKEPIAKKGARITSHIALPGRFLVFMPTVNHVGVSRKISSDEERQRLKRILVSEKGTTSGGFIVRTAADGAGEEELRADIRFLIGLWSEIKQRSDAGKAPALIYHDLNLVERILRDQVSDNFSTIWVDHEAEYERIVRFLNRFQPSLVRRVKLYSKETPLFEQFGIQDEITKALKSKVWLKSGGSIVINQTEALVAIDINTGKYVGKTARLEDTILKTNLDAIPEIVRQIRLRDLGGIIVIDFIDMDERKNRNKVMQALEEALKADRAPSKVLQFNDFGLVAITRKRVKQSLERTLSVQCSICAGTGMVKSPATVCNEVYIEMRKMQRHLERHDVLLRVNPEVVKTLKANNARWLTEMEEMTGKTIIVKSDPALHPEQFDIH